jgi:hypothetical protein
MINKYFKRLSGELLVDPIESNYSDLTSVTAKEFKKLLDIKNAPAALTSAQVRDNALAAIESYDFKDGRVIQIRIKDRSTLIGGIEKGITLWKMKDNKRYSVTTEELQIALSDLDSQIKAIWQIHLSSLEEGKTYAQLEVEAKVENDTPTTTTNEEVITNAEHEPELELLVLEKNRAL